MENKITLLVVENRDFIPTEYCKLLSFLAWKRKVYEIRFWHTEGRRAIWHMRREMIKKALVESKFTHLLFIDTDVIPKDDDFIDRLLSHNVSMVSGVYYDGLGRPVNQKNEKRIQFFGNGLMEVDVFSMGFSLIKREVLEKVEYPEPKPAYKLDADAEFCKEVKKASFPVYTDFGIIGKQLVYIYTDENKIKDFAENSIVEK